MLSKAKTVTPLPRDVSVATYGLCRCVEAMSFNGFDLASNFPYTLGAGETGNITNIQYYGKLSLPPWLFFCGLLAAFYRDTSHGRGATFLALDNMVVPLSHGSGVRPRKLT